MWGDLPPGLQLFLGTLIVLQLSLVLTALYRLFTTRAKKISGLGKPVWFFLILFAQLPGSIAFLILESRERRVPDDQPVSGANTAEIISDLYRDPQ